MPILMFAFLGMTEAAFLFAHQHTVQRSADVLADIAAERMAEMPGESWQAGWTVLVDDEANRVNCADHNANVTFPDGSHGPGDRVDVELRCTYEPIVTRGLWPGLVIRVHGESVVRSSP